jgi:hypothetical protein
MESGSIVETDLVNMTVLFGFAVIAVGDDSKCTNLIEIHSSGAVERIERTSAEHGSGREDSSQQEHCFRAMADKGKRLGQVFSSRW